MATQGPRYAYEDPAALAWGAQMVREWGKRKRLRLAAQVADSQCSKATEAQEADHDG